tara:strand:+ start:1105 stop:1590 length:486 start_codon:yes stop_codon:yes gene_type:complete
MGHGKGADMQITKATAQDIPQVAGLWHVGWHQGHADIAPAALVATRTLPEFLTRTTAHLDQTFIARKGGVLAGFYMLSGDEVYQFYVDAAFRGQGVAAILMASAETALAGRPAWLACSVGNDRAAAFYTKTGWKRRAAQTYSVETASGPFDVEIWRFEKNL